jgi:DNA repair exonuclease SbcCD ATPase subunit
MINAIAVEFENILCFKERQRFEFSQGLHLITGVNLDFAQDKESEDDASANNGIGKSALATIVRFACFGYAKDTNKNILINKEVGNNLRVRFEFSIKNDQYVIERYKKHHEHKENLYLFKNVADISASNKTQTQQDIIDLLVITDDTYLKCSLFTREDNPQFLSLTPSNRSKIFENIVHLSKFKKKLENVKSKKRVFTC